jgi:hypothetical protein
MGDISSETAVGKRLYKVEGSESFEINGSKPCHNCRGRKYKNLVTVHDIYYGYVPIRLSTPLGERITAKFQKQHKHKKYLCGRCD